MNPTQSALAVGVEHEPILTDLTLRSLLHLVQDPIRTTALRVRKTPPFWSLEFGAQRRECNASTSVVASLYKYHFFLSCPLRLTLVRVSTSHQKVVLEIDFSGSLWVRCLTLHPSTSIAHRSSVPSLTSRDTQKLPSYQTTQTCGLFISILDSAVCSSCALSVLPAV